MILSLCSLDYQPITVLAIHESSQVIIQIKLPALKFTHKLTSASELSDYTNYFTYSASAARTSLYVCPEGQIEGANIEL